MQSFLDRLDVIGLKVNDGIEKIRVYGDYKINIIETVGTRKNEAENLEEARIIKITIVNDVIDVVIGFF